MPETTPGAASAQPAQPPFGSSPATQPTPNKGYEAAGLQRLGLVIRQLESLLPMLGSGSDPGKDVLKALNMLAKHVPAGSTSPAAEKNNIEQLAMRNAQQSQMAQQARKPPQAAAAAMPQAA